MHISGFTILTSSICGNDAKTAAHLIALVMHNPSKLVPEKFFCSFYPIFVVLSTIFNYVYCKLDMLVYVVYRILWCMFFVKCCKYEAEFISRADIFCADKT